MDKEFKSIFDREVAAVEVLAKFYSDEKYGDYTAIDRSKPEMQVRDVRKTAKLLDMQGYVVRDTECGGHEYPVQLAFMYGGIKVFSIHKEEEVEGWY